MPRRTKAEAEKTRLALLDAAELIFYKKGVSNTSLQEIAEAAGVTRGAVYWHFKDKIEILEAMFHRVIFPQEQILEQLTSVNPKTLLADFCVSCKDAMKKITQDSHDRRVLTILMLRCEYTDEMALILRHYNECTDRMANRAVRLFERAKESKMLNANWTPRVAAVALHGLMSGLLRENLEREQNAAADKIYLDAIAAFFRSVSVGK